MSKLSFSSVLLISLVTPIIMNYRISPGQTPYWLFGLIFLLMLAYLVSRTGKIKDSLFWVIIVSVVGSSLFSAIIVRHQTAPVYGVHDIILQSESALQFLLQGKNPYQVTYFGTPLEQWHYSNTSVNPALFHFVMMPWYLLFSLPFYFTSISILGFFDGRMPLVVLYFLNLILAWRIVVDKEQKKLFVALLALSPATFGYFLEGRSDFFMFAFLFFSWFLLEKKRFLTAGAVLALAFATKQSCWPIFPFYLAYLWLNNKGNLKKVIRQLAPFIVTFSAIVIPFLIWDKSSFINSTVFYLSGKAVNSYPISGYGWGMVLQELGIIRDLNAYYPFWIWQLIFCLPLAIYLIGRLRKSVTVGELIVAYGIFTFAYWYFSRYFNNSHLGFLSMVFVSAYFWQFASASKGRLEKKGLTQHHS